MKIGINQAGAENQHGVRNEGSGGVTSAA